MCWRKCDDALGRFEAIAERDRQTAQADEIMPHINVFKQHHVRKPELFYLTQ